MTFGVVLQEPEKPIREVWRWDTSVFTVYDGGETSRVPLLRYPRKEYSGSMLFTGSADVRRHLAMMTQRYKTPFLFPLFQYQCKLKTGIAAGADTVSVNALRSDLREGAPAVLIEGAVHEEVVIAAVAANSVQFAAPVGTAFTSRAILCPLAEVFTGRGAPVSRFNTDEALEASFNYIEPSPPTPFLSPLSTATLETYDGMVILSHVPVGTTFSDSLDTGVEIADYLATPDFISPWNYSQWALAPSFLASRIGDDTARDWWQAFGEAVKGSSTPFLFPTNRNDLEVVTPAAGGGSSVVVFGDEYTQHYWGHGGFSRIFIDSEAGRHYATVTGIAAVDGNDLLTFSPALPAGAGWDVDQEVGFLLKARIADDTITCLHYSLHTEVNVNLRTVL